MIHAFKSMSKLTISKITVLTILFVASPILLAGTVVEIKSDRDISIVKTDGKQARMEIGDGDYIIVNYQNNSVKMVNNRQRQVLLLSADDMPKSSIAPKIQTSIKHLGSGPNIAGYKTQKFNYIVNGKSCGIIYGSKDAYQLKGIKDLFKAMRTMAQKQQAMMGSYAGMIDDCTLGDIEMSVHIANIGVPMRTENNGSIDSEIKSIKLNVTLPADTFVIPASYKTVTINDEMQKASKEMTKMQRNQPDMQQMMQQMQKSGQMPPEIIEQMRRAQERMNQYQQQR